MVARKKIVEKGAPSRSPDFEDDRTKIRAAQIRQLYSQTRTSTIAAVLGAVFLALVLWNQVEQWRLVIWVSVFLAVQTPRLALLWLFRRSNPTGKAAIPWLGRFLIGSALSAALWGCSALFLFPSSSIAHQCLLGAVLLGVAAVSAMAHAPITECYLTSIYLTGLPVLARLVYEGGELPLTLAFLGLVLVVALTGTSRSVNSMIRDSIKLRFENEDLIDHLRGTQRDLEMRVQRRTAQLSAKNEKLLEEIAEQEWVRKALLESEEKYRLIFEFSPLGVFHFDRTGTISACNDNFVEIIGSSRDKLVGLHLINDLKDPKIIAAIKQALSGEMGRYQDYYQSVTADKITPVKVEFGPIFGPDGSVVGGIGIVEDITERMKAEDDLRKSEEQYRTILETIADGYHETDIRGTLTLVNDSLCRILGRSREELVGLSYREIMDEQNAKRIFEAYNEVYRTGQSNPGFSYQIIRKDGKTRDVVVSIALIRDAEGSPCGFRGMFRDITEQKVLEEQLRQAAKMEAIGRLAGGIAHNFNNLLTAMIGYSSILMQQLPARSQYQEKLVQISRAAQRAATLTQQLLAFGRKQVLDMKSLDLNMVISDFETMLRRLIGENIEVKTFLKPSLGTVEADPGQIDQILMNLAVNARDAMPEGGALTIETDDIYLDGDYCRSHPEVTPGNYLLFAVTDTGRGMDTETLGRIFDPFFTTKEKGVGTGLGLATVYGIVKQHRGHVSVYSEVGRGTTFKVYLPRIEGALEPFTAAQAFTPDRGTETVLVVEDEEAVRDISCEALAMLGYLPLAAADSDEAIAISEAHSGRIHLLLTDVVLPKKDGRSLYELLAKTRPDMKALFMSGYTENFVVHHGVLDKEVHFIQKPFTVDHLARKIREVLDSA